MSWSPDDMSREQYNELMGYFGADEDDEVIADEDY